MDVATIDICFTTLLNLYAIEVVIIKVTVLKLPDTKQDNPTSSASGDGTLVKQNRSKVLNQHTTTITTTHTFYM
eukprot:CAMPEP_0114335058 /NCGR_PEP_ID=MMETSP0101-20121206/4805_1 /TAXON_ID=38822 ORGANISM="Pteridomonas danica, Strain PT" /NCGR_SAMPLE_ID=MMETSP0101 /ASSEMBLY_ACC=CAM_ASM_000211 /LENGTH=73 /DNA_ID=CAMNT_0001466557 /DNA_START=1105 /DNA_END=1326 /DNA_ORIENTATION=-